MKLSTSVFLTCALLSLSAGCQSEDVTTPSDEAASQASMPVNLLAVIALDDASIEFHEPMMGEIATIYLGRDDAYLPLFEQLDHGTLTHTALYELVSGEVAPDALAAAQARMLELRAEAGDEVGVQAAPGVAQAGLTAAAFSASYCPGGWSMLYCWTSETSARSVTRTTSSMHTYLNAYAGTVQHKLEYTNAWGNMVVYVSQSVQQGFLSYISRVGLPTTRRSSSSMVGAGDGYHMSVYGNN